MLIITNIIIDLSIVMIYFLGYSKPEKLIYPFKDIYHYEI
jgi:hypothetical protein